MIINVKVKPNSGKQEVERISSEEYKVYVKSKAENNKANLEVVKLLEKHFKMDVKILRGKISRNKVVEVVD